MLAKLGKVLGEEITWNWNSEVPFMSEAEVPENLRFKILWW